MPSRINMCAEHASQSISKSEQQQQQKKRTRQETSVENNQTP